MESISLMNKNLGEGKNQINLDGAKEIELKIDEMRDTLRAENLKAIGDGKYDLLVANYYKGVFYRAERIGDFAYDVSCALACE